MTTKLMGGLKTALGLIFRGSRMKEYKVDKILRLSAGIIGLTEEQAALRSMYLEKDGAAWKITGPVVFKVGEIVSFPEGIKMDRYMQRHLIPVEEEEVAEPEVEEKTEGVKKPTKTKTKKAKK